MVALGILEAVGHTPLVRLHRLFPDNRIKLFAKLEGSNPGGSIKDRPAVDILAGAIASGALGPDTVVIESSSGNMGIGLAQACRYYGLRFLCVIDPKTTEQNIRVLRAYGAEIVVVREPDPQTGEFLQARLEMVRRLLDETKDSFWPNQYENLHNPGAHTRTTMREIWEGLKGEVDYLFAATSTFGTVRGCAEFVRGRSDRVRIVAVDAVGSRIFRDESGPRRIPGLGAGIRPPLCDPSLVDRCIHVSDLDSVLGCRRLLHREAILAGGSSGAVIAAVGRMLPELPDGANCVAILCDRGERYLDTIFSDEWVARELGAPPEAQLAAADVLFGREARPADASRIASFRPRQTPQTPIDERPGPSAAPVILLTAEDVRAGLAGNEARVIEIVARAYLAHDAGASHLPHSSFLRPDGVESANRIIALPAYLGGEFGVAGLKWIASFPSNVERGAPRASAVLVLNSCADGTPRAILEGSIISAQRTAASAALAARVLTGSQPPESIGIIGTGLIAAEIVRYLGVVLPGPRRWLLFDVDPERANAFAEDMRRSGAPGDALTVGRVDDVLSACGLIVFATTAIEPHVRDLGACPPGAVILHVSLRDLSPECVLGCDNIVDDVDHVLRANTSLHLAEQATGRRDFIRASLAELLRGAVPVRRDDRSVVVFSPFGLGVLDLAVGQFALESATAAGHGREIADFGPRSSRHLPARVQRSAPETLVDVVRRHAAQRPDTRAFTFLANGEDEAGTLTFAQLDTRARAIAARLLESGLTGERALLVYPSGLDFIAAFLGCLYAGVVAVPVAPPRTARSTVAFLRLNSIVSSCQAKVALTNGQILRQLGPRLTDVPLFQALTWEATDRIEDDLASRYEPPKERGDLALLQYTSGSTSDPRGARVTHAALLHNLEYLKASTHTDDSSVGVTWLPHFHDMGLVIGLLMGAHGGYPTYLMSPLAFVQRPLRWLEAMARYGATISGGPNSTFDLCVRKSRPAQRAALDLSTCRVMINGAEPVFVETLESFYEAFHPCGFAKRAFCPAYGLAESTVLVSCNQSVREPHLLDVHEDEMRAGRVVVLGPDDPHARRLTASGSVEHGMQAAIVDPETLRRLPPDRIGEIWVRGPSLADGYWDQPESSRATFQARIDGEDGAYLRTGDLGFVHGGELFITGRRKDLIILDGANYYPHDLERAAEQSHPALRPGCSAAFSVTIDRVERLVIMAEVQQERGAEDLESPEILAAIRRAIADAYDVRAHTVRLLPPGSIPKTSSGKIRRQTCRQAFIDGTPLIEAVLA